MRLGASRRHLQRRPPDRGNGPLAIAAWKGHLEMVQVLLAAGASVEAKNDNGCGPQRRDGCYRTDVGEGGATDFREMNLQQVRATGWTI